MMSLSKNSALSIARNALMSIADLRADRRQTDDYNRGWEHGRYQAIKIAEHALEATKGAKADDEHFVQPSHIDEPKVSTLSETETSLKIDLTQAIEAAYYAGAKDWVRNTHPEHYTRLEAKNRKIKPTIEETTAVRRLMDRIWCGSWVRHTESVQDVKMQESVDLLRPVFAPNLDRVREVVKALTLATPFSINASTAEAAVEWMRSMALTGLDELDKVDRRPR